MNNTINTINTIKLFAVAILCFFAGVVCMIKQQEYLTKKINNQNEVIAFLIKANTDLMEKNKR